MGDAGTANAYLNWADKNAHPINENGLYYYPRDDSKGMGPQDNVLLTGARVNVKDGMRIMHTQLWTAAHFAEPYISNVDYPNVLVTQAIYDSSKKQLMVTLIPGASGAVSTSFNVNNLDPAETYSISRNGYIIGHLVKGVAKGPGLSWAGGVLTISPRYLGRSVSFIVQGTAK
jgi:hypothetical protein